MKSLVLFLLVFLCQMTISAQYVNQNETLTNDTTVAASDSIIQVDSMCSYIPPCDTLLVEKSMRIEALEKRVNYDSLKIDSLLEILNIKEKEIDKIKIENTKLRSNIGFVDTCMVKLANRWLYEKYNKSDVDEAIKYFDRIYSSKLKDELSIVQRLLRDYERSYKDFQFIIQQAQQDIDRENPFAVDSYKEKYIHKIKSMLYYMQYYNEEWNIRYLNEQINRALDLLNNHSGNKQADFSYIIDN